MTRWLVTGAGGQLGRELVDHLAASGVDVVGLDRRALDVADRTSVAAAFTEHRPDVVVNTAAYTAVDAAETDVDGATAVNTVAPGLLAAQARRHGARLLHVSTDYVFAGDATRPYEVDDPTAPASVYGRSKRDGEIAALEAHPEATHVVRTAWVYGRHGGNFVRTMMGLEATRDTVDVVDDQTGAPTWTYDLARGLAELGARTDVAPGVLHLTNAGSTTWCGLARAVFAAVGADPDRVHPTTSDRFVRPAPRPAYSVLSGAAWEHAGLTPLQEWSAALAEARIATWR